MQTIQPGGTIGVLGGGQLGRMFTLAARQMGFSVFVLSPEPNSPAGQVADAQLQAEYDDPKALNRFINSINVATIEFENIPVRVLERVESRLPARPAAGVLRLIQNRLDEKTFLRERGYPVAPFHAIRRESDLRGDICSNFAGVLKTASSGYDGKGQKFVASLEELNQAWESLGRVECVLESFVDFQCEFSVIVARTSRETVHYAPILNAHQHHVLDISSSPANLPRHGSEEAIQVARDVADALNFVGVMCVEFFLDCDDRIVINEIAPRPHNSGHLTIEAHATSQFEQQVRAVCGLPLGSTKQLRPAAMANLLGDHWSDGIPAWSQGLSDPEVSLHLYGKRSPRAGRKMGHLTCLSETSQQAASQVARSRSRLGQRKPFEEENIDFSHHETTLPCSG